MVFVNVFLSYPISLSFSTFAAFQFDQRKMSPSKIISIECKTLRGRGKQ